MSTENGKEKLDQVGIIAYKRALRIVIIGGIVSFVLLLLAVLSLFIEGGDSAGPGFYLLGAFSLAILVISCLVSLFISVGGIIQSIAMTQQSEVARKENRDAVNKNLTIVLGITLLALVAYKILT